MQQLPKGVMIPEANDFAMIQAWAPLMGQSIDELLPYRWDNAVDMNATVPTEPAQYGFRTDEGMRMYRWDAVNSEWVPAALTPADQNFFRFETKAEMDLWVGQPGQKAVVWGDSTPANNAEYVWESGAWRATKAFAHLGSGASNQTIPNTTTTTVTLTSAGQRIILGDIGYVGSGIEIQRAGIYKVSARLLYVTGGTAGSVELYLMVNGNNTRVASSAPSNTSATSITISELPLSLDEGDIITLAARQSTGGNRVISNTNVNSSWLTVEKV